MRYHCELIVSARNAFRVDGRVAVRIQVQKILGDLSASMSLDDP